MRSHCGGTKTRGDVASQQFAHQCSDFDRRDACCPVCKALILKWHCRRRRMTKKSKYGKCSYIAVVGKKKPRGGGLLFSCWHHNKPICHQEHGTLNLSSCVPAEQGHPVQSSWSTA